MLLFYSLCEKTVIELRFHKKNNSKIGFLTILYYIQFDCNPGQHWSSLYSQRCFDHNVVSANSSWTTNFRRISALCCRLAIVSNENLMNLGKYTLSQEKSTYLVSYIVFVVNYTAHITGGGHPCTLNGSIQLWPTANVLYVRSLF